MLHYMGFPRGFPRSLHRHCATPHRHSQLAHFLPLQARAPDQSLLGQESLLGQASPLARKAQYPPHLTLSLPSGAPRVCPWCQIGSFSFYLLNLLNFHLFSLSNKKLQTVPIRLGNSYPHKVSIHIISTWKESIPRQSPDFPFESRNLPKSMHL